LGAKALHTAIAGKFVFSLGDFNMRDFFVLFAFGLFFSGCGGSSDSQAGKELDGIRTIAVIPKGTSHAFWKSVHEGARQAGEEYGVRVLWDGPQRETEIDRQRAILENMLNQDAVGVAIAPLDEQGMARPIQQVIRRGIPVVIFDSDVNAEGYVSFVATDNEAGGGLAGQRMNTVLRERGVESAGIMVLRYAEGSGSTLRRENGFINQVNDSGHKIEAQQFTDGTPEGALTVASNMLSGLVEDGKLSVQGIFASNESTSVGLLRALDRLARSGVDISEVVVVGFDSSPDLLSALESGMFDALVVQNPRRMGYLAVQTLVKHLDGINVEPAIDTGAELITRENLDTPNIRMLIGRE